MALDIRDYLTIDERLDILNAAASAAMPSEKRATGWLAALGGLNLMGGMGKSVVDTATSIAGSAGKMTLGTALIAGVPIGIAAHVVDRAIRGRREYDKNLRRQRDYYIDAGADIERRLAHGSRS